MSKKVKMDHVDGALDGLTCDFCRSRPARYRVRQDGTRLCELCLSRYLAEHKVKVYQVKFQ